MAKVVDKQNAGDKAYQPMSGRLKASAAFQAASDLVFKGLAPRVRHQVPLLASPLRARPIKSTTYSKSARLCSGKR